MKTMKDVCESHYDKWIYDCSGFLKAVATDVGITLKGQANDIVETMKVSPWIALGHDAEKAVLLAGQRHLVVAGLKALPNGHVAVVLAGSAKPHPTAYWGSISKHPGRNKTLNWCWVKTDLPKVQYFAHAIPTPISIK
ncbi:MAG: hypothetical protein ABW194_05120 [Novosphingobium sp.]